MSISTILTSTKNGIVKYLPKAIGAATIGLIGYDAHILGKMEADVYAKSSDADACLNTLVKSQYLSGPSASIANMKKSVHNLEVDSNTRHFVNSGVGYFKGFGSMLIDNIVPLIAGGCALFGKGKLSKLSAIGLAIYGGVRFFKDVLGFGHYNDLERKY